MPVKEIQTIAHDRPATPPVAAARKPQARITGIDICRSFAILLAMFSHALVEAGTIPNMPASVAVPLRFTLQMAPPIFIILFGTMLEIVYKTRFEDGQYEQATRRLLTRALQCYLLYVVTILSMLAVGLSSPGYALRCILMMGVTPYADILKFYTLALAFAPALLAFRLRWGLMPLVVVSILVHLAHPLVAAVPTPPLLAGKDYISPVLGFLTGMTTQGVGGPSVLHGMTFVIWGMVTGQAIKWMMSDDAPKLAARGWTLLASMLVLSVAVTLRLWNWDAPLETFAGIATLTIRNANMPIYFTLGLSATVLCVVGCILLYDRLHVSFGRPVTFAGRTSLFTFSFGNVLLYLAPNLTLPPAQSWAYAVALFLAICVQSYVFWRVQLPRKDVSATGPGVWLGDFISLMNRKMTGLTGTAARHYGGWLRPARQG